MARGRILRSERKFHERKGEETGWKATVFITILTDCLCELRRCEGRMNAKSWGTMPSALGQRHHWQEITNEECWFASNMGFLLPTSLVSMRSHFVRKEVVIHGNRKNLVHIVFSFGRHRWPFSRSQTTSRGFVLTNEYGFSLRRCVWQMTESRGGNTWMRIVDSIWILRFCFASAQIPSKTYICISNCFYFIVNAICGSSTIYAS